MSPTATEAMTQEETDEIPRAQLLVELEALRAIEQEYRLLLDESSDPIFAFFPNGEYRYVNRAFARGVGRSTDQIIGHRIWDIFPKEEADKRFAVVRWVFEHAETKNIEVRVPTSQGDHYYLTTVKPIIGERGEVVSVICISKDITERKLMEQRLAHLAQHDALTDLPNRALFSDRLKSALAHARRDNSRFAVLSLDLDHFKPVNDNFGHLAGDRLLKAVAQRLLSCIRESDSVGRIGGDEFLILLPHLSSNKDARRVADKIHRILSDPFELEEVGQVRIGSCIGIAIFPEHGDAELDLLRHADAALYHAKRHGRNRVQLFEPAKMPLSAFAGLA